MTDYENAREKFEAWWAVYSKSVEYNDCDYHVDKLIADASWQAASESGRRAGLEQLLAQVELRETTSHHGKPYKGKKVYFCGFSMQGNSRAAQAVKRAEKLKDAIRALIAQPAAPASSGPEIATERKFHYHFFGQLPSFRRWANTGENGAMQEHPLGEFILRKYVLDVTTPRAGAQPTSAPDPELVRSRDRCDQPADLPAEPRETKMNPELFKHCPDCGVQMGPTFHQCVEDKQPTLLAELQGLRDATPHHQHTVWKDGIDIDECWPTCVPCKLDALIKRLGAEK